MNIKKICFFLTGYLLFCGYPSVGQTRQLKNYYLRFDELTSHISKNFKADQVYLDTACIHTVIAIKFKIIDQRIDSLEFSTGIPKPLKQALQNALMVDNGNIMLVDTKAINNRTVLIPVIFNYSIGCNGPAMPVVDSNGSLKTAPRSDRFTSLIIGYRDLLNFESGRKGTVDCILLPAMYFTSMY